MYLSEFDFDLPAKLIAQEPPAERGQSRLLALDRSTGSVGDRRFSELPSLLDAGDLLVVNDTKVFAARLLGRRFPGGGVAECLLLRRVENAPPDSMAEVWEALVHPGQRLKEGSRLEFGDGNPVIRAEVLSRRFHGRRTLRLETEGQSVTTAIDTIGHVPLPPYIKRADRPADRERYQTVFAAARGSVAAPTAGLHFTAALLAALDACGVERTVITLHVGYGTFQPIRNPVIENHRMEAEHYEVSAAAAAAINRARRRHRRVVAVGTTTTRTLESLPIDETGDVRPGTGSTDLFIRPGHRFGVVTGLITNFHLPQSSLLLLVCAFAGRDQVLRAYRHAVDGGYRFYSYGDAMLVR
jgi:S-adenosylmethionine:tRNA ribosyltransferase-isomerase